MTTSIHTPRAWTDERVERAVGTLLRAGLIVAAVVVLAGGVTYLASHGSDQPAYRVFHGEPADLRTIGAIVQDSLRIGGTGLIQLGVVLLLMTPVARVVFSVAAFALQREPLYVAVTLVVLSILLYSIFGRYA